MKAIARLGLIMAACAAAQPAAAQEDLDAGKRAFRVCGGCHLLAPGRHITGPSLAGVFGRKAGTAAGFPRYSPAMRQANLVWSAETLDKFLADPAAYVKGNWMTFPGVEDAKERANLIAYLRSASQTTAAPTRPLLPTLKGIAPNLLVTAIRSCGDSYYVTTADGATRAFWEFNLRFKTNSTAEGPDPGKPAIMRAGMGGDRASVIFASPKEISDFIQIKCE